MAYGTLQIGITGPRGRIGSGDEYHIDSKYNKNLTFGDIVDRFDTKAAKYGESGRNIVFSNPDVAGLVYNPLASRSDKEALLQRVAAAHSHSISPDFHSFDFYAPIGTDRYDKSAEGAPIYLVGAEGLQAQGGTGGGYGNFASVADASGVTLSKVGHGDTNQAVFAGSTFGSENLPMDASKRTDAVAKAKSYSDMSKAELDAAYDKMRSDPNAAAEGMKMHKAYFGKK